MRAGVDGQACFPLRVIRTHARTHTLNTQTRQKKKEPEGLVAKQAPRVPNPKVLAKQAPRVQWPEERTNKDRVPLQTPPA